MFAFHGEMGWRRSDSKLTLLEWCVRLIAREHRMRQLGELSEQFLADCFSKVEDLGVDFKDITVLEMEEDGCPDETKKESDEAEKFGSLYVM